MYAYAKKYGAERVVLLRPRSGAVSRKDIWYRPDDGAMLQIAFLDLLDADASARKLLAEVC